MPVYLPEYYSCLFNKSSGLFSRLVISGGLSPSELRMVYFTQYTSGEPLDVETLNRLRMTSVLRLGRDKHALCDTVYTRM